MDQHDSAAHDRAERGNAQRARGGPAQESHAARGRAAGAPPARADALCIVRVGRGNDDRFEVWTRVGDAPILGVSAIRLIADAANWEVAVAAASLVPPPLEHALHTALYDALIGVPAVVDALQAGREIWMVHGEASGEALVRACAHAVDAVLADGADRPAA